MNVISGENTDFWRNASRPQPPRGEDGKAVWTLRKAAEAALAKQRAAEIAAEAELDEEMPF